MRLVIALGGNAILKRGESLDIGTQRTNIITACRAIKPLVEKHDVLLTHGNGPQVGLLALQSMANPDQQPYPLDVLGAETEGMIGYLLAQELHNEIPEAKVANLMTQTLVDQADPAFDNPTKFIGPVYTQSEALQLKKDQHWQMGQDGEHYRRVVPSPKPQAIVELAAIKTLFNQHYLVICTGGGGVPVTKDKAGKLIGVEGVVDKDWASALLAHEIEADELILLTDVDAVYKHWATADQSRMESCSVEELSSMSFAEGSMQPKVSAACHFVEASNGIARIGALQDAAAIINGEAGTRVHQN